MSAITSSVMLAQTTGLVQFNGGGTQYVVSASNGALYAFYVDTASDIQYKRSFNNGTTWSTASTFSGAQTITQLSVWYDGWSGINDGHIHVAWVDSVLDDVVYKRLNTVGNTTSSAVSASTALSTATNGALSICRARGGMLYIAWNIDGGTETFFVTSSNTGSTWGTGSNPNEATTDSYILMPGYNADANDMHLYFWDHSANEISVKRYDASANSWAETSITASMVEQLQSVAFPHFAAFPDLDNSRNVLAAWSAVDTANARLSCWTVDDTTSTKLTDIVPLSVDDQGLVALGVDKGVTPNVWYAFYGGKTDGSEVYLTNIHIYYKTSSDAGSTWGSETRLTDPNISTDITWMVCTPIFNTQFNVLYHNDAAIDELRISQYIATTAASSTGGSITFS